MQNHAGLRQGISDRRDAAHPETRRRALHVGRRQERRDQERPRHDQRDVHRPAPAQRFAERSGEENPIVEKDRQRRGGDRLLGQHPQEAGGERGGVPAARPHRERSARDAVQSEQVEEPRERLRALDDVGHRFGLERVDLPDQRRREGQRRRRALEARAQGRQVQRQAHQPEQRQRRQDVHDDVEGVKRRRVHGAAGESAIDRQAQVQDRPVQRQEECPRRPEMPDRRVRDDLVNVVEDERVRQAVGVHRQAGEDDDQHREPVEPLAGDPRGIRECRRRRRIHADILRSAAPRGKFSGDGPASGSPPEKRSAPGKERFCERREHGLSPDYRLFRLASFATKPVRPSPSSVIVAGSGTKAAAGVLVRLNASPASAGPSHASNGNR